MPGVFDSWDEFLYTMLWDYGPYGVAYRYFYGDKKDAEEGKVTPHSVLGPLEGVKDVVPKSFTEAQTFFEEASNKIYMVIKGIINANIRIYKTMVQMFTFDAYKIYGLAPYITLPGMISLPFFIFTPEVVNVVVQSLTEIGIRYGVQTMYVGLSVFYWIVLWAYLVFFNPEIWL